MSFLGSLFSYVNELSVKKQDKALINAQRAQHIRIVLTDPKDTSVGSAQFRCAFLSITDYYIRHAKS
jgi:hypothetical protein